MPIAVKDERSKTTKAKTESKTPPNPNTTSRSSHKRNPPKPGGPPKTLFGKEPSNTFASNLLTVQGISPQAQELVKVARGFASPSRSGGGTAYRPTRSKHPRKQQPSAQREPVRATIPNTEADRLRTAFPPPGLSPGLSDILYPDVPHELLPKDVVGDQTFRTPQRPPLARQDYDAYFNERLRMLGVTPEDFQDAIDKGSDVVERKASYQEIGGKTYYMPPVPLANIVTALRRAGINREFRSRYAAEGSQIYPFDKEVKDAATNYGRQPVPQTYASATIGGGRALQSGVRHMLSGIAKMNQGIVNIVDGPFQFLSALKNYGPTESFGRAAEGFLGAVAGRYNPLSAWMMPIVLATDPESLGQGFVQGYTDLFDPNTTPEQKGASLFALADSLHSVGSSVKNASRSAKDYFSRAGEQEANSLTSLLPEATPFRDSSTDLLTGKGNGPLPEINPPGSVAKHLLNEDSAPITGPMKPQEATDLLAARTKAKMEERGIDWNTASNETKVSIVRDSIADEVSSRARTQDFRVGQYDSSILRINEFLRSLHPDATQAQIDLFHVMSSPLSNGTKAFQEAYVALKVWDNYMRTGRLADEGIVRSGIRGDRGDVVFRQVSNLQKLYDKCGADPDRVVKWLKSEHSIDDLKALNPGLKKGSLELGPNGGYYGFSVFGPKIGSYMGNKFDIPLVTKDIWQKRLYERVTGTTAGPGKYRNAWTPEDGRIFNAAVTQAAADLGVSPINVVELAFGSQQKLYYDLGVGPKPTEWMQGISKYAKEHGMEVPSPATSEMLAARARETAVETKIAQRGTISGYGRRSQAGKPPLPGDIGAGNGFVIAGKPVTDWQPFGARKGPAALQSVIGKSGIEGATCVKGLGYRAVAKLEKPKSAAQIRDLCEQVQKAAKDSEVTHFIVDYDGPDGFYEFDVPASGLKAVKGRLGHQGITCYAFAPTGKGYRFAVIEPGARSWFQVQESVKKCGGTVTQSFRGSANPLSAARYAEPWLRLKLAYVLVTPRMVQPQTDDRKKRRR